MEGVKEIYVSNRARMIRASDISLKFFLLLGPSPCSLILDETECILVEFSRKNINLRFIGSFGNSFRFSFLFFYAAEV